MGGAERFEELAARIERIVEDSGGKLSPGELRDVLWETGLGDLIEDLSVAEAVIIAADGFHPVARFFAEGSAEQEFIGRVLGGGATGR